MIHEFPDPVATETITYNPTLDDLRDLSAPLEQTTEFGSPCYVSEIRSRSADRTRNAVDHEVTGSDVDQLERAHERLLEEPFVCVDRRLGRDPELSFVCRLFVPERQARIALSWATLLEPVEGEEPDFHTLQIPDWEDIMIRVFPDEGTTYVLGSDYTGEAKKSFLRLFMYHAKRRGGLGLHAGTKRVRLATDDGARTVGQLFLGLSATGKTTLTCHGFGLEGEEAAELVQDDVCALLPDGSVPGSEGGGLYIKTIGLSAANHPELYRAATQPGAVLENVMIHDDGSVDFHDDSLTRNGRASVRRADLQDAAPEIDLERADQVFFITRNPLMPPVAKLSPEEAAAAFMLGESIETSAGDPDRAGESIRVVGTNPFIIGSEGEEGNRFLELVRQTGVEGYLINTGEVGIADPRSIEVEHSVAILRAVARGDVSWAEDERTSLTLPETIPGIDVGAFYPPDHVEEYDERLSALRAERREYLAGFPDLEPAVVEASLVTPLGRRSD